MFIHAVHNGIQTGALYCENVELKTLREGVVVFSEQVHKYNYRCEHNKQVESERSDFSNYTIRTLSI